MRRVLIVAYYFPPLGGMGSIRTAGFVTHLPEYGWEPWVLTPRAGAYFQDHAYAVPETQVRRTASFEISRTAKRVLRTGGDDVKPAQVGQFRGALQRVARQRVYYPDAQIGWYPSALLSGRKLLRERRFDAVMSSAAPITAHLVARKLGSAAELPWVADFRDPWSEYLPPGTSLERRGRSLERKLARAANRVVMPAPYWAELHAELWGRGVDVVMNGFEPVTEQPVPRTDGFTLGYLGTLYPERQDLLGVWDALKLLDASRECFIDRVRFIGAEPRGVHAELAARGLERLLEVTGFLGYPEAIATLRRSSALLIGGPKDASGIRRGEIPGKLFEYLATDLPIIYVGDLRCDAADLLHDQPGCWALAPRDVDGISQALAASRGETYAREISRLSRAQLTGRLALVLDEAVGQTRR